MSTVIFSEIVCFSFSDCITAFGPAICHFQTYSSIKVTVKAQDKSVGCSYSVTKWYLTLWDLVNCSMPGFPVFSWSLPKLMSIESVMPSNHLILCHPLLFLPSISPSIRVFSNESVLHIRWPKYWSFRIGPSNEHSGLISFRMDWFDLLAVQGTL